MSVKHSGSRKTGGNLPKPAITLFLALLANVLAPYRVFAQDWAEVWTLTQWAETRPEQQELMRAFERRVAAPMGEPMDFDHRNPLRITLLYPALQASDYWRRNVVAFEARLREIGVPYELDLLFSRPGDAALQSRQLRQALVADPDYLIVTVDALRDVEIIERLLGRGRPRLILQNTTTPLRLFGMRQPLLYAGFDHEEGSSRLADYFNTTHPNGADWVLLLFTDGYVSNQRGGAFLRVLSERSNMRLHEIYLTEGDREKARRGALDALERHPSLDFFFACATDVALGAADALRTSGRAGACVVNGWGGGDAELQAIVEGNLIATVMRMNDDTGVAMAEAIALDISDLGHSVPTVYAGAFELITHSTTSEAIHDLRKRAFRYSGTENLP